MSLILIECKLEILITWLTNAIKYYNYSISDTFLGLCLITHK
jgi:hypothetical protein